MLALALAALGGLVALVGAFALCWQAGLIVAGAVCLLAAADLGRQ